MEPWEDSRTPFGNLINRMLSVQNEGQYGHFTIRVKDGPIIRGARPVSEAVRQHGAEYEIFLNPIPVHQKFPTVEEPAYIDPRQTTG